MSPTANSAFSSSSARLPEPRRVIVSDQASSWSDAVSKRLEDLIRLPDGWDGYQAPPVRFLNAQFTVQMLRAICPPDMFAPQVVPGSSGDLQIEWHTNTATIELHVRAPNSVIAWRQTAAIPDGEEIPLTNDFAVVVRWIREMLGDGSATVATAA